mmetsp:Transcript_16540/g.36003  ORF Transcript_16540/g.36003 Transcript_16540/m.36003 type:complete len:118 (-) Transcript_16540:1823-2176(-)
MESNHPCERVSFARTQCHAFYGIQNEECVREELTEKRCYAELLCRREAVRFYYEPLRRPRGGGDSAASCSTLVEIFAFPENKDRLPDNVDNKDRKHCRGIVHELAKCLSKHKVGQRR